MKCSKCGSKIDASMTFCGKCGAAVVPCKQSAGAKVVCILLSIVLTVSLLLSVTFSIIHSGFGKRNLTEWIDTLDVSELTIPAGQNGKAVPLSEFVYDNIKNEPSLDNVTKKTVEKLINKQAFKDVAKDVIAEATAYLFDGKHANGIPTRTVVDMIEQNESRLVQAFVSSGILTDDEGFHIDYEKTEKMLEDMYGQTISIEKLTKIDSSIVSLIRFVLSDVFLLILWLLTALWVGLLVLADHRNLLTLTLYIGIPLIIVAGIYLGIIIAADIILASMTDSIIFAAARLIISKMVLSAVIMGLVGILSVISCSVIKKIMERRHQT